MEVGKVMFVVVACVRVLCVGPRSKASYGGVDLCEYYVWEYVPVHHPQAPASAASLYMIPVCDLTLPICVM